MTRRRQRFHPDQLELLGLGGRRMPTSLSRATARRGRRSTSTPAPKPWQCVVLAVDTARTSGWSMYDRGALLRFGEVDVYDAVTLGVLVGDVLEIGAEARVPVVLVLEAPFGGAASIVAALGAARECWLRAWRDADQTMRRVVLVLPNVWRGPVLGGDAVSMPRDLVRELEVRSATRLVQAQLYPTEAVVLLGNDEAAAVLIGRWASHAAAVGRVIGKRATRASVAAWMQRHG